MASVSRPHPHGLREGIAVHGGHRPGCVLPNQRSLFKGWVAEIGQFLIFPSSEQARRLRKFKPWPDTGSPKQPWPILPRCLSVTFAARWNRSRRHERLPPSPRPPNWPRRGRTRDISTNRLPVPGDGTGRILAWRPKILNQTYRTATRRKPLILRDLGVSCRLQTAQQRRGGDSNPRYGLTRITV